MGGQLELATGERAHGSMSSSRVQTWLARTTPRTMPALLPRRTRVSPTGRFPWISLSCHRQPWVWTLQACPVTDRESTKASGRASATGELSRILKEDPDALFLQS